MAGKRQRFRPTNAMWGVDATGPKADSGPPVYFGLAVDPAEINQEADTGEKMVRNLRAGLMPPAGEPRPSFATLS